MIIAQGEELLMSDKAERLRLCRELRRGVTGSRLACRKGIVGVC